MKRKNLDTKQDGKSWYTYFFATVGGVKLGRTTNLEARMNSHRYYAPIATYFYMDGDYEQEIFKRFAPKLRTATTFTELFDISMGDIHVYLKRRKFEVVTVEDKSLRNKSPLFKRKKPKLVPIADFVEHVNLRINQLNLGADEFTEASLMVWICDTLNTVKEKDLALIHTRSELTRAACDKAATYFPEPLQSVLQVDIGDLFTGKNPRNL